MIQELISLLQGLPKEFITVIVAMLPIAELRGSIPVALSFGMNPWPAFWWSILGNMIPVVPILLFLGPVSKWLRHFKIFGRFFTWLFTRTEKKSDIIQKYGFWGLAIFVCIPLPVTGAWTGCVAGFLLQMKFWRAFFAILLGVLIAGGIVMFASLGIIKLFF
ncbi:ligand-binding protein SH3 [Candidatus Desantisbacteria bacterium CG07_land_8_20_14_0_80_39_15]|nr:MAG: ligand-binding protein SH3 [Candidatus Desantisbacteria bacterium CG07_land_8_20_14_0_80_39_15]PIZ16835.1 MAG: ligand-binding protein SH3 [Candidatus Desantisbacteria bacterium CG_4_10_14_0_8_um_filter_39_17]